MKKTLIISSLIISAGLCYASPLTPDQAIARLQNEDSRHAKSIGASNKMLASWSDENGIPAIYLFSYSDSRGFLLVAADDAVSPLLGYSETGTFNILDMSETTASWISQYLDGISSARTSDTPEWKSTRADDWAPVEPLLTTRWAQENPYNGNCPMINGRKAATGCVATAMAQVMKYWEYPTQGKGSIAYVSSGGQELSLDFSSLTFEWENMLDKYGWNDPGMNQHAVAVLMQACGYAVKMEYGINESVATTANVISAMTNYFDYDRDIALKERSQYSSQESWNRMIYNELTTVGPVIYGGVASMGGHCFIVDGYDGKGMFHINWGWGGMSDGYFLLEDLNPSEVGTGGYLGGFNAHQHAVTGLMPPVGRITLDNITIDNAAEDSGNVKGWGYTYRIKDPSNIQLSVKLKISGGHISSPLYAAVYETDPDTKANVRLVYETSFDENLNVSNGNVTCSTRLNMPEFNPSQLYTIVVSYELKGQRSTIGTLRMAASSGVDDIAADNEELSLWQEGTLLNSSGPGVLTLKLYNPEGRTVCVQEGLNPSVDLSSLAKGIYLAQLTGSNGSTRQLKLLLK